MVDITVYRGDTKRFTITIKDGDKVAIDISSYTFKFTVKENATDTQANAKIAKTVTTGGHSDPTHGITIISLSISDTDLPVTSSTQKYVYDMEMTDGDGNVRTFLKGNLIVLRDITITD